MSAVGFKLYTVCSFTLIIYKAGWVDELGPGVRNTFKYAAIYSDGRNPVFKEDVGGQACNGSGHRGKAGPVGYGVCLKLPILIADTVFPCFMTKLFLAFCFLLLTALPGRSQQTEPAFVYKHPTKDANADLGSFLSRHKEVPREKCLYATGALRFRVSKEGKIVDLQVTGKLPDTLVQVLKARLLESEPYWVYQQPYDSTKAYKWFVQPVFVTYELQDGCRDETGIMDTYGLLLNLFQKGESVITTSTSYLLSPYWRFVIR